MSIMCHSCNILGGSIDVRPCPWCADVSGRISMRDPLSRPPEHRVTEPLCRVCSRAHLVYSHWFTMCARPGCYLVLKGEPAARAGCGRCSFCSDGCRDGAVKKSRGFSCPHCGCRCALCGCEREGARGPPPASLPPRVPPHPLSPPPSREEDAPHLGTCVVCMERPRECVVLPCGHISTCMECQASLKACPLCRRKVGGVVRIFLV